MPAPTPTPPPPPPLGAASAGASRVAAGSSTTSAAAAAAANSATAPSPTVYLATYSSVPVYEITVRGIACMRRRADGYLNATQILKIAGVEKARRTKILEKEILTGEHEKVQGGYGKYQGTWIPLKRAQELSASFSVTHLLKPLLEFDPATAATVPVAAPRRRPNPNAPSASIFYRSGPGAQQLAAAKAATSSAAPPSAAPPVAQNSSGAAFTSGASTGPSQQPRFLSLRPPPSSQADGNAGSTRGSTGTLLSASAADPLSSVLRGSAFSAATPEPGIPAGSSTNHRDALSGFSSLGYTPQGVALPGKRAAANDDSPERSAKRPRGEAPSSAVGALAERTTLLNGVVSQPEADAPIGLSPVKDLNALGRTSPSSALRGARAPLRVARAVLGPPDNLRSEDGPRYADRPQLLREGDEGERRMRERLTSLFIEGDAATTTGGAEPRQAADASAVAVGSSSRVTPATARESEVAKLDALLASLKHAVSLAGGTIQAGKDAVTTTAATTTTTGTDQGGPPACIDLVIDDHGHTALHWASALARLPLVRMLLARPPAQGGANPHGGNHAGETALHRSVLVTNSYEASCFPELLQLLRDSLHTRDLKSRTLLHHVAHVAALPGRAASARYYLACVLDHVAKREGGRYAELVDAQDEDGDTALGIVARVGNASMVRMLLDVGARKDLANKLGVRPSDWGIEVATSHHASAGGGGSAAEGAAPANIDDGGSGPLAGSGVAAELAKERPQDTVAALRRAPAAPVQKSKDVQEQLSLILTELADVFERERGEKQSAVSVAQAHLLSATRELASRRRELSEAQRRVGEREEARLSAANLARLLRETLGLASTDGEALASAAEELVKWSRRQRQEGPEGTPAASGEGVVGGGPERDDAQEDKDAMAVDGELPRSRGAGEARLGSEPPLASVAAMSTDGKEGAEARDEAELAALRWLEKWYSRSVAALQARIAGLEGESTAKQAQCRKVVALCCAVDEERVEDMLPDLVTAIESDGADVDLARLAGFLEKVKRSGGAGGASSGTTVTGSGTGTGASQAAQTSSSHASATTVGASAPTAAATATPAAPAPSASATTMTEA